MTFRYSFFVVLVVLPFSAFTQDNTQPGRGQTTTRASSQEILIELLEFLGEFETIDGEWISPEELLEEAYTELDDAIKTDDENE